MKQHHLLHCITALLTVLILVVAVSSVTAFAAPEDQPLEQQDSIVEEQPQTPQEQVQPQEQPQEQPQDQLQEQALPQEQQNDPEQIQEPEQEEWYDYIYNFEDATSAYEEPENLGELPAVTPSQVVEATAVAMPAVAVSDASLFSGIVMWLCVALGIAVIVGVLVSKRTRRRGA